MNFPFLLAAAGLYNDAAQHIGPENAWILNFLAWTAALTLLATLALTLKKLFGRTPSLTTVIEGLVTTVDLKIYKDEQHLRNRGLEEQISKVRHDFSEAMATALVRENEREKVISTLRDLVSRLQERTETHIRQLDSFDTKLGAVLMNLRGLTN